MFYITDVLKLIFKAYRKTNNLFYIKHFLYTQMFMIFKIIIFYNFFFLHVKMTNKYYQKYKENPQK